MNIQDGQDSAARKARADSGLFEEASRKYSRLIQPLLGSVPRSLALGHILRVNPELTNTPPITLDRRRGFMLATQEGATTAKIGWTNLDDPSTCAYVWCREVNQCALDFYLQNDDIFDSPDEDFWKIVYLRHVLGTPLFNVLWEQASDTTYSALLYTVNALTKSPMGMPISSLKKLVLHDLAYVFELAIKKGSLKSTKFGIQPVMDRQRTQRILMSDNLGDV